ncbi:phosphotransferase [Chloroflexota bacterium]
MMSRDVDLLDMQSKLLNWLRKKMPNASNFAISDLERSGAGFTNESFLFDLSWDEGNEHKSAGMILRCEGTEYPIYPEPKVEMQFRILEQLGNTNVPVPRVYWFESDSSLFGTPFYLMNKFEGSVPSEFPPYHSFGICYDATPELREKIWWQLFEGVARLHTLDWKSMDFSFLGIPSGGTSPIDQDLAYWENFLEYTKDMPDESHPILETALAWLKENRYEPEYVSLCWGDARFPNSIFNPDGDLLGLLDWDISHIGDPESDLGFILTTDYLLGEGIGVPRLDGFPSKEETIQRYEELTGRKVKHYFFNEVRAACVMGIHVVKVQRNLKKIGVSLPGDDPDRDNFCTQYLAKLLNLPAPGSASREITKIEDLEATVQIRLAGPDGGDWYLVCDKGNVTRYNGIAENPTTTVITPANTWAAIQKGEMNQFHAWTSGELQIEGDHTVLHLLEDVISRVGN